MGDSKFIESIEFKKWSKWEENPFPPFKWWDKVFLWGEAQMQKLIEFYLKDKTIYKSDEKTVLSAKKNSERFKINCVLGNNWGGKSKLFEYKLRKSNLSSNNIPFQLDKMSRIILDDFFCKSNNMNHSVNTDYLRWWNNFLFTQFANFSYLYSRKFTEFIASFVNMDVNKMILTYDWKIKIDQNTIFSSVTESKDYNFDYDSYRFDHLSNIITQEKVFWLNGYDDETEKLEVAFLLIILVRCTTGINWITTSTNYTKGYFSVWEENSGQLTKAQKSLFCYTKEILMKLKEKQFSISTLGESPSDIEILNVELKLLIAEVNSALFNNGHKFHIHKWVLNFSGESWEKIFREFLEYERHFIWHNLVFLDLGFSDWGINKSFNVLSWWEKVMLARFTNVYMKVLEDYSRFQTKLKDDWESNSFIAKEPFPVVVFIDEPDLHLHLDWQKKYIQKLIDVFSTLPENIHVHFILATHSPFIISDLPNECIVILDWSEKNEYQWQYTEIKKYMKKTFWANYVDIINDWFFFHDKVLMWGFAESIIGKGSHSMLNEILLKSNIYDLWTKIKRSESKVGATESEKKTLENDKEQLDKLEEKLKEYSKTVNRFNKNIKDKIWDEYLKDNLLYFVKWKKDD